MLNKEMKGRNTYNRNELNFKDFEHMYIGVARCFAENSGCTKSVAELQKKFRKYWNRGCAERYRTLANMDNLLGVSGHIALQLMIIADYKVDLRILIINLINLHFSKYKEEPKITSINNYCEVGTYILVQMYRDYLSGTYSEELTRRIQLYNQSMRVTSLNSELDKVISDIDLGVKKQNPFKYMFSCITEHNSSELIEVSDKLSFNSIPYKVALIYSKLSYVPREESIKIVSVLDTLLKRVTYWRNQYMEICCSIKFDPLEKLERKRTIKSMQEEINVLRVENSKLCDKLKEAGDVKSNELKIQQRGFLREIAELNKKIKSYESGGKRNK